MDILMVLALVTIIITMGIWIVMLTFLWWELIQLRKIRTELSQLPGKLSEAVGLMDNVTSFSQELRDQVLPEFIKTTSEVKLSQENAQSLLETKLKEKPPWFDFLVGTLETRIEKGLKRLEDEIKGEMRMAGETKA